MVVVVDGQVAGLSGDMILSSLVDLGADVQKIINGIKRSEQFFPGSSITKIDFKKILKHGIESTQLILEINEDLHERDGSDIKNAIVNSVNFLEISHKAQTFAVSCIDTLILSESKIHGIDKNAVHLHEASSIDTMVDIVGIAIAIDDLNLFDEKIVCLPVSVGNGTVTFSHGIMSNPASAILEIFKNSKLIIAGTSANAEMTTPTGACILANLATHSMTHYPLMQVDSIGYGAGQKDFQNFSNILKITLGSEQNLETDSVKILETNVDDVSGEILGNLIEKIMSKGAKDVSVYPGITKKGRPTSLISVICSDHVSDDLINLLVSETGTLGIRISDSRRFIVPRTAHTVSLVLSGHSFEVRYKKSFFNGKTRYKIEFDDLKKISDAIDKSIWDTEIQLRKMIDGMELE